MLNSGDVLDLDLGVPAVLVTAQDILDASPSVVQVVPVTSTIRGSRSEVAIDAGPINGLTRRSVAQCQHIRAVSATRIRRVRGNVGAATLAQLREMIAIILDL